MPSRIYCRGLRRAEEGGDDEGPERLGAPYSSGTSAARDTSSGRLLKGKMPLSVHFFRDAEADALNMERCQLDKATLIACAVKRLREDLGNVPDSGKKPSA